jgi:hypothetical protein
VFRNANDGDLRVHGNELVVRRGGICDSELKEEE